jgi:hypothetical protein
MLVAVHASCGKKEFAKIEAMHVAYLNDDTVWDDDDDRAKARADWDAVLTHVHRHEGANRCWVSWWDNVAVIAVPRVGEFIKLEWGEVEVQRVEYRCWHGGDGGVVVCGDLLMGDDS